MIKRWGWIGGLVFYAVAGANHFLNPGFYLPLIPSYLPSPGLINTLAGLGELAITLGLLLPPTRKLAAYGLVALLVAFIPSHIYFIQFGACIADGLCTPMWVAWLRLLLIHPLLIWWAWYYRNYSGPPERVQ